MGVGSLGEAATSAEISGPEEAEDEAAYEEESIVHHTASIGDAEVSFSFLVIFFFFFLLKQCERIMPWWLEVRNAKI